MSGLDKKPTANRCLNGQVAGVTGAGRGIGRAIALAVARAGADVAVNDLPESETLQSVVQECQALGVRSVAMPADLGDRQEVEDGINQVLNNSVVSTWRFQMRPTAIASCFMRQISRGLNEPFRSQCGGLSIWSGPQAGT